MDASLTGHVNLSSREPADSPAAQVAVLDPLERLHPAESVGGGGTPEPVRVGDREPVQVPVGQPGQLRDPGPGGRQRGQLAERSGPGGGGHREPGAAQEDPEEGSCPGTTATCGHVDP